MRARFFNRQSISGFMAGFVGGFRYGYSRETLIAQNASFNDSSFLKAIPAVSVSIAMLVVLIEENFRLNALPAQAASTVLGFALGSYVGAEAALQAKPSLRLGHGL